MPDSDEIGQIKRMVKELTTLDSWIQKINTGYLTTVKNIEEGTKKIKDAGLTYVNLGKAQKETQKSSEELDRIGKQLAASEQKLKDLEDSRTQTIIKNRNAATEQNKITRDEIILNDKNSGTLEKLSAQNRILDAEKKKLNLTTNEGKKRLTEINKEQDKNNKIIQESSNQLQKQKINIGNYKSAFEGAGGALGSFSRGLKALLANPVILIVAGIVGAFKELKSAFESSERGREVLAKGLGFLKGIGQVIFNIFSNLTEVLINAFEDPKEAIIGLWEAIKTNIVNRFTGLITLFQAVGNGLKALWGRDLGGLKQAAQDAGTAIVQIGTGLDKVQQSKAAESLTNQFKESRDILQQSVDLQVRQLRLREAQIGFITKEAELNRDIVALRTEASDQTVDAVKRLQNIAEIEQKVNELVDNQKKLKQEELSIITLRNALGKNTLDDTEKEKQLQADLIKLDETRATEQRSLVRLRARALDQLADTKVNEALQEQSDLIGDIAKKLVLGQITVDEYQKEFIKATQGGLQVQIDAINSVIETTETTQAKRIMLEKQRANLERQLSIQQANEQVSFEKAKNEAIINEQERIYELTKKRIETSILDERTKQEQLFELDQEYINRQIENQQKLLENTQLTADKRIEIEQSIKDKQAELDQNELENTQNIELSKQDAKTQSLEIVKQIFGEQSAIGKAALAVEAANAIRSNLISLGVISAKQAEAQSKSAAALPFPFNIPLILGTIAQFVSIISIFKKSKVPKFAKGTENAPGRFFAGEEGRELMTLRSGETFMVDKPTYFEGQEFIGAKIKSNAATEQVIRMAEREMNIKIKNDDRMLNELIGLRKDIKRQRIPIIKENNVAGYRYGQHKNNYWNKLING